MAKLATVKFGWTRSPSPAEAITNVELLVKVNGQESVYTVGKEVESFNVEVKAPALVSFKVVTYGDEENDVATSQEVTFTLSDLESVQPATNLTWQVVGVRDEEPVPPPEPTPVP